MTDTRPIVLGMADVIAIRMAERRLTPGAFAKAAGLTPQGLSDVRSGIHKRYAKNTIYGVANALAWEVDWYDRLQRGEEPLEAELPLERPATAANAVDLSGLSEEDQAYVLGLVERLKGR